MAFLIGGANSAVAVDTGLKSLRFNDADSAYLDITPGVEGDRQKWTISAWVKRGALGIECGIMGTVETTAAGNTGARMCRLKWDASDNLGVHSDNPDALAVATSAVHRDPSAWYHIVCACDTTQSTDTNRLKFYVNGTQLTSFGTTVWPTQNEETGFGYTHAHRVGWGYGGGTEPLDGYLSEVYFIDGTQYAASNFGEFDGVVWKPTEDAKDSLTFGDNGFYLEFKGTGTSANSSGKGADTSGEGNHLDDTNLAATDQTTDIPDNNFATLNPLTCGAVLAETPTLAEGNCQFTTTSSSSLGASADGTMAPASGKWYWEVKNTTTIRNGSGAGIIKVEGYKPSWQTDAYFYGSDSSIGSKGYNYNFANGNPQTDATESTTNAGDTFATDDIIGLALDLDNGALYYSRNGTFQASGDPTSGGSKTGAQHSFTAGDNYAPACYGYQTTTYQFNFGNPPYANSSNAADAAGYGAFEYTPPSGYYALCTKNLAEFG